VKKALVLLALLVVAIPAFAQENVGTGFDFSAGLGTDLLPDPNDPTTLESWSKLALQPEFSVGKFGIGLDLMLRFKLGTGTSAFEVYEPDWIPHERPDHLRRLLAQNPLYPLWNAMGGSLLCQAGLHLRFYPR